ncbi:MAG: tRNA lysidine(34) synthetase TilS [Eubacterium sp.]|nr:tRNA lysidine(34) synthetase TilS [Eubacterium sp.]
MDQMRFVEKVKKYISDNQLFGQGDGIVIGLSGGADSVSLLLALNSLKEEMGLSLAAVHLNHMIRGAEADRDESFVRELCGRLGVKLVVFKEDIPKLASEKGLTEEEAGRLKRYELFEKVMREEGFTRVAVAHNSDDLAETVIFNMARGSSIRGLAGIQARRGFIVRPILGMSRREIEEYLSSIGQDYVTDSTNNETEYSRNLIRHEVLPRLAELNAGAKEHIIEVAEDVNELYDFIAEEAGKVQLIYETGNYRPASVVDDEYGNDQPVSETGDSDGQWMPGGVCSRLSINIDDLEGKLRLVRYEIYLRALERLSGRRKDITRQHLGLIDGLRGLESGKQLDMPYDIRVRRSYGELVFEKKAGEAADGTVSGKKSAEGDLNGENSDVVFIDSEGEYSFGGGVFSIKVSEYTENTVIPRGDFTKMFDYDRICGKLCFRYPAQEDHIKVTEEGSKKLSRLFTDMKLDREKRKSVTVLAMGNDIIWAVGSRISEDFKVKDSTKKVMIVEYKSCRRDEDE